MISKHKPNQRQQSFWEALADTGCCNCGGWPVSIHHCAGSAARHNKVKIGHWFVLPLCWQCHQGTDGIHGLRARFNQWDESARTWTRKGLEKFLFAVVAQSEAGGMVPDLVKKAIREYRK